MTVRARLMLTVGVLALAAPAQAADVALLIDAGDGEATQQEVAYLGDALNARGYEVYEPAGAGREQWREAIAGFADRLGDAERAIVVFAGRTLEDQGRIWLLPADFDGEGWIDAAFDGLAFEVMLALAAERPGRSAVVLARDEAPDDAPDAAAEEAPAEDEAATEPPFAAVPQGVLVVAGPREAALTVLTDNLLAAGPTVAEALEGVEDVTIAGFVSPDARFVADLEAEALPPRREPAEEEAAVVPDEPAPQEQPEAAEAALDLGQGARRRVQEDLTVLGYSTRGIDGIFGPGTRAAIAEWQGAEGFDATGFLAPDQIARLREQAEARSGELAAEAERMRAAEEAADAEFWRTTGAGGTAADLRAYLARYPDGLYAAEAREQLARLEGEARAEAEAEDRAAWDAAEAADDAEAYRAYLEDRPEGAFAEEAQARIDALEDAPLEEAARTEAAAREEALGLNRASRALIEGQLAAVGFDVGAADGSFDDDTRAALRAFQSRQGLEATGYVDQATVQALIIASIGLR